MESLKRCQVLMSTPSLSHFEEGRRKQMRSLEICRKKCYLLNAVDDHLQLIFSFLSTKDLLRLRTCRKLRILLPKLVTKIHISTASRRAMQCINQFIQIRSLSINLEIFNSNRNPNDGSTDAIIREYVGRLRHLEEIDVVVDDLKVASNALLSIDHTENIRVLSFRQSQTSCSILLSRKERLRNLLAFLHLILRKSWSSLKCLRLAGDWFDTPSMQFLLLQLSSHGIFNNLEVLELYLPTCTSLKIDLLSTLSNVLSIPKNCPELKVLGLKNMSRLSNTAIFTNLISSSSMPLLANVSLDITSTTLTSIGVMVKDICNMPFLKSLSLSLSNSYSESENDISHLVKSFPRMEALEELKISNGCAIDPLKMSKLFQAIASSSMPNLISLSITNCCLNVSDGDNIPQFLSRTPHLKRLDISGNFLNDENARAIASSVITHCPQFEFLKIGSNRVTEIGLLELMKLFLPCAHEFVLDVSCCFGLGQNTCFPNPSCVRTIAKILDLFRSQYFQLLINKGAVSQALGSLQLAGSARMNTEYSIPRLVIPIKYKPTMNSPIESFSEETKRDAIDSIIHSDDAVGLSARSWSIEKEKSVYMVLYS